MPHVTRKKNGHLIEITRDDGTRDVSWDWNQLLAEVKTACDAYEASTTVQVVKDRNKKSAAKKPAAKKKETK